MIGVTKFVQKRMVNAGKGRGVIGVNNISLMARGDSVPQLLDEAGQVGLTGASGQEPVLSAATFSVRKKTSVARR